MTRQEHIEWLISKSEFEPDQADPEQIRRDFFETLKHCGYIVPDPEVKQVRTGFMCKIDFECELGAAMGGNHVYPSISDLRRNRGCVGLENIAEVEVREVRVVEEGRFDSEDGVGCGITEVEICEVRTVAEEDLAREEKAHAEWEAKWAKPDAGKDDV